MPPSMARKMGSRGQSVISTLTALPLSVSGLVTRPSFQHSRKSCQDVLQECFRHIGQCEESAHQDDEYNNKSPMEVSKFHSYRVPPLNAKAAKIYPGSCAAPADKFSCWQQRNIIGDLAVNKLTFTQKCWFSLVISRITLLPVSVFGGYQIT